MARADQSEQGYDHPPDPARPWVYWFWNNGNVTKKRFTADLEAMQRVGVRDVKAEPEYEISVRPAGDKPAHR